MATYIIAYDNNTPPTIGKTVEKGDPIVEGCRAIRKLADTTYLCHTEMSAEVLLRHLVKKYKFDPKNPNHNLAIVPFDRPNGDIVAMKKVKVNIKKRSSLEDLTKQVIEDYLRAKLELFRLRPLWEDLED